MYGMRALEGRPSQVRQHFAFEGALRLHSVFWSGRRIDTRLHFIASLWNASIPRLIFQSIAQLLILIGVTRSPRLQHGAFDWSSPYLDSDDDAPTCEASGNHESARHGLTDKFMCSRIIDRQMSTFGVFCATPVYRQFGCFRHVLCLHSSRALFGDQSS